MDEGRRKQLRDCNADIVAAAAVDGTPADKDTKAGSAVAGHRVGVVREHAREDGGRPYSPEKTAHSEVPTYMAPRVVFAAAVSAAAARAVMGADGGSSCPASRVRLS